MISSQKYPVVGPSTYRPFREDDSFDHFVLATATEDFNLYHISEIEGFETKWNRQILQQAGSSIAKRRGSGAIDLREPFRIKLNLYADSAEDLNRLYYNLVDMAESADFFGRYGYYYYVVFESVKPSFLVGGFNTNRLPVVIEGYRLFPDAALGKITNRFDYENAIKTRSLVGLVRPEAVLSPPAFVRWLNKAGEGDDNTFTVRSTYYSVPSLGWSVSDDFPSGELQRTSSVADSISYVVNTADIPKGSYAATVTGAGVLASRSETYTFHINEGTASLQLSSDDEDEAVSQNNNVFLRQGNPDASGLASFSVTVIEYADNLHGFDVGKLKVQSMPSHGLNSYSTEGALVIKVFFAKSIAAGSYIFNADVPIAGKTLSMRWILHVNPVGYLYKYPVNFDGEPVYYDEDAVYFKNTGQPIKTLSATGFEINVIEDEAF